MHSGKKGSVEWHKNPNYIDQTVDVIERLARRYKHSSKLWGIELLNEPAPSIPHHILKAYYRRAYRAVRKNCGTMVKVVVNDIYRPKRWRCAMHWPIYKNVWFDSHQYQIFTDNEKVMDVAKHVMYTQTTVRRLLRILRRHHYLIIGEWSAALDKQSLIGLEPKQITAAYEQYYDAQKTVYELADGWFYWTYKMESVAHPATKLTSPWAYRLL
jgi:glucan 1,3-beta-glucosidase